MSSLSTEIHTRDLLEDLIDIRQYGPMKVAIFPHSEQISEAALRRFQHRIFDSSEFTKNVCLGTSG